MSTTATAASREPQKTIGRPRLIFWELTKGCNLRCIHCRATATELSSPLDLPTEKCKQIIDQIADYANPILVLSGGEPLYRKDCLELARYASDKGIRVALATNGTLVTEDVALRIAEAGVKRVSISLDGVDEATHDAFRAIPGAYQNAVNGMNNLKKAGVSFQINMTITRHNAHQLPEVLELTKKLAADALHTFLLVPVGCGVEIADKEMVDPQKYEEMLNWFYDRSLDSGIELKATCAPHYFRVVRQRRAAERKAAGYPKPSEPKGNGGAETAIGPTDMTMPGSMGMAINAKHMGVAQAGLHPGGHSGGHPGGADGLNAMTKGCLAGTGVCFISNVGEVYPCGYLPVMAGDLKTQPFAEVWETAKVFEDLRDTNNLEGKCGACEFRNVCMGCRARAYAVDGNYLAEEPFCIYEPRMEKPKAQ
jgi:AdoMet-dependent heme synthase